MSNFLIELDQGAVKQYQALREYQQGNYLSLGEIGNIKQITANQTSFTALSTTGSVYTWGDPRYEACLGRDATEEK